MTEKIERLADLVRRTQATPRLSPNAVGRSAFTQRLDALLLWVRRYLPPLHWLGASLFGLSFYPTRRLSRGPRAGFCVATGPGPMFRPEAS